MIVISKSRLLLNGYMKTGSQKLLFNSKALHCTAVESSNHATESRKPMKIMQHNLGYKLLGRGEQGDGLESELLDTTYSALD